MKMSSSGKQDLSKPSRSVASTPIPVGSLLSETATEVTNNKKKQVAQVAEVAQREVDQESEGKHSVRSSRQHKTLDRELLRETRDRALEKVEIAGRDTQRALSTAARSLGQGEGKEREVKRREDMIRPSLRSESVARRLEAQEAEAKRLEDLARPYYVRAESAARRLGQAPSRALSPPKAPLNMQEKLSQMKSAEKVVERAASFAKEEAENVAAVASFTAKEAEMIARRASQVEREAKAVEDALDKASKSVSRRNPAGVVAGLRAASPPKNYGPEPMRLSRSPSPPDLRQTSPMRLSVTPPRSVSPKRPALPLPSASGIRSPSGSPRREESEDSNYNRRRDISHSRSSSRSERDSGGCGTGCQPELNREYKSRATPIRDSLLRIYRDLRDTLHAAIRARDYSTARDIIDLVPSLNTTLTRRELDDLLRRYPTGTILSDALRRD